MTAKGRLNKAKSSLEKLRFLILKDGSGESVKSEDIHFELENFLTAIRSVLDHLLEDYNERYLLGIPLTEKLYPSTFEEKAKIIGNKNALLFMDWYNKEKKTLMNEPACSFLIEKRHISLHRKEVKPVARRTKSFTVNSIIGEATPDRPRHLRVGPSSHQTLGWFFVDNDKQDILTMCIYCYKKMEAFVEEAEKKFP